MPSHDKPSLNVVIKLAALAVHAENMLEGRGIKDGDALVSILRDPEVAAYLSAVEVAGMLPRRKYPTAPAIRSVG